MTNRIPFLEHLFCVLQPETEFPLERDAFEFASEKHYGQIRKYSGRPYITHPVAVAGLVYDYAEATPEMVAAALLHDVVEDCGVTGGEIFKRFGPTVAGYVWDLTKISKPEDGNRQKRKEIDRDFLANVRPESKTIKLADILHNSRDLIECNPDFVPKWYAETIALFEVLKDTANPTMVQMVDDMLGNHLEWMLNTPRKT